MLFEVGRLDSNLLVGNLNGRNCIGRCTSQEPVLGESFKVTMRSSQDLSYTFAVGLFSTVIDRNMSPNDILALLDVSELTERQQSTIKKAIRMAYSTVNIIN